MEQVDTHVSPGAGGGSSVALVTEPTLPVPLCPLCPSVHLCPPGLADTVSAGERPGERGRQTETRQRGRQRDRGVYLGPRLLGWTRALPASGGAGRGVFPRPPEPNRMRKANLLLQINPRLHPRQTENTADLSLLGCPAPWQLPIVGTW